VSQALSDSPWRRGGEGDFNDVASGIFRNKRLKVVDRFGGGGEKTKPRFEAKGAETSFFRGGQPWRA